MLPSEGNEGENKNEEKISSLKWNSNKMDLMYSHFMTLSCFDNRIRQFNAVTHYKTLSA